MFLNPPNLVTLLRILLVPLIVGVFYVPDSLMSHEAKNLTATVIFVVAALTDWLDGYLARTMKLVSAFGAFFDPVADKLVVVGALIVLLTLGRVDMVVALIIVGREIAISALREWMAIVGKSRHVAVAAIGKVKTAAQMIAIPLLLYEDPVLGVNALGLGTVLINIAAVLTVISMLYYLRRALPGLRG